MRKKPRVIARRLWFNRHMEESMKRTSVCVFLVLSIMGINTAFSQEQATQDTAASQTGPPPQMKEIAFLAGTWDVALQVRMNPQAPWMDAKAVSTYTLVLDGCAMQSTFEGDMGGMLMKGLMLTCYNKVTGKWQTTWADNFGSGISLYEGDYKDGIMTFTGKDETSEGTMWTRITQSNMTNAKFDWLMEMSMDGGKTWVEPMKAVYTKRQ
jgi:hypothetical protein